MGQACVSVWLGAGQLRVCFSGRQVRGNLLPQKDSGKPVSLARARVLEDVDRSLFAMDIVSRLEVSYKLQLTWREPLGLRRATILFSFGCVLSKRYMK